MRRTLLISALTAIVVMAIAVFAVPRLGTAIAEPDSPEAVAARNATYIAMVVEKAKKAAAFMAAHPRLFNSGNVAVSTAAATAAPEGPEGCCSTWQGFNVTGTLVSPAVPGVPCTGVDPGGCVPGAAPNHFAVPWPEGRAFVGGTYVTTVSFHSTISGPCMAFFGWWSIPLGNWVAGSSRNFAECGPNIVGVAFFSNVVPNTPGDTIAIGVIQASDGTTDVDYMQFLIQ